MRRLIKNISDPILRKELEAIWEVLSRIETKTAEPTVLNTPPGEIVMYNGKLYINDQNTIRNLTPTGADATYLKADGSVPLTGNLSVTALKTIDGVDVGAHKAATAKAGHDGGVGTHSHASAGAEGGVIIGGADKQVQFNDGGVTFGTDTLFVFNKTNDWLGLGIATPLLGIHIKTTRKSAGVTACGIIIEALASDDCPGVLLFDSSGTDLADIGLCLKDHNYAKDAHINDLVLRCKTGNIVFATDDDLSAEYFSKLFIANGGNVAIGKSEIAPETLLEMVGTAPYLTIHNDTHEDIEAGRESRINFKGEQSGGEETTLARIQASHDGTGDDEKADLIFYTNDGNDGDSPTERMRIDSDGLVTLKGDCILETDKKIEFRANGNYIHSHDTGKILIQCTDILELNPNTRVQFDTPVLFASAQNIDASGGYFLPRRVRQAAQPTPAAGEMMMWCDSDDSDRVYMLYNDATGGVKKVELT